MTHLSAHQSVCQFFFFFYMFLFTVDICYPFGKKLTEKDDVLHFYRIIQCSEKYRTFIFHSICWHFTGTQHWVDPYAKKLPLKTTSKAELSDLQKLKHIFNSNNMGSNICRIAMLLKTNIICSMVKGKKLDIQLVWNRGNHMNQNLENYNSSSSSTSKYLSKFT